MIGNPADEFAELRQTGIEEAQRAVSGQAAAARATASDSSGTVTVSLNSDGQVEGVRLSIDAKDVLGPAGIGPAVQEAVQAAAISRLSAWAEAFTDDEETAAGRSDAAVPAVDLAGVARQQAVPAPVAAVPQVSARDFAAELERLTAGRSLDSEGVRNALHELLEVLERVDRGLDEATGRAKAAAAVRHTGISSDRHVRVTVTGGGELVEIQCDPRWIPEAHEINIGRQITSAFREAYQIAARNTVSAAFDSGELGQVRDLLRDPAQLARLLRLTD